MSKITTQLSLLVAAGVVLVIGRVPAEATGPPTLEVSVENRAVAIEFLTQISSTTLQTTEDLKNWKSEFHLYLQENGEVSVIFPDSVVTSQGRFYRTISPAVTPEEMRTLWQREGFERYRFQYRRICSCPEPLLEATVEVSEGEVTSVKHVRNLLGVSRSGEVSDFRSIEGFFDLLEEEVHTAYRVRVSYHEELGYPARIDIDTAKSAGDDQVRYEILGVVRIR